MDELRVSEAEARFTAVAFIAGFLTASLIAVAFFSFLGLRIGFTTILQKAGLPFASISLDMPSELIDELAAMDAVIDNAGNPTGARKHDTIIVRPDDEFEKMLRSDASVDGFQIRARNPLNLDPPVVYTPVGATFSKALRSYLEANTRVRYTYNVDSEGFRRTLPQVNAEKKILVVGDSATFGVGIEDEDTIPSVLQRLVGDTHRIVNAGVPGFDADQCFRVARWLSEQQDYEILIYVAHTNDFKGEDESARSKMADKTIADFESLKSRFPGGIVVAFFVPLEYAGEDVLLSEGWTRGRVEELTRLRGHLADLTRKASLPFVDLGDIIAEIRAREKTIFALWSLYVDRSHLSPRGTRTLAEHTFAAMSEHGLER